MNRFPKPMVHSYVLLCMMLSLAHPSFSDSNTSTLFCDDLITVSVGPDCDLDLDPMGVLEGNPTNGPYALTLEDSAGNVLDGSDLTAYIGKRIVYIVTDADDNECWGHIALEDKIPPTITCTSCTERPVEDPACILNCAELKFFKGGLPAHSRSSYDINLLDDIIITKPSTFLAENVDDNCGQEVDAAYEDTFLEGECGENTVMTRTWTVSWTDGKGQLQQNICEQYFLFEPIDLIDDLGNPIIILGDGMPLEDAILLPPERVEIHECNMDISPESIAAYFDDPTTEDLDTDDNGIDPEDGDIDWVIENNEGIWQAYPHYYIPGLGTENLHAQPLDKKICNVDAIYHDIILEVCDADCTGNVKLSRTWTIFDWCAGEYFDYQQVIKLVDSESPTIDVSDYEASVDPWSCDATVRVPAPEHLYDDCDEYPTYFVELPGSINQISGNHVDGFTIHNLPIGEYTLVYKGVDCCDNITRKEVLLTVVDKTPPVPVTVENIVVDLVGTGYVGEPTVGVAKVFASDIDNGSYDGCTDVEVYVRRDYNCSASDTIWTKEVKFCCADLGANDHVLVDVEFRVVDKAGNENFAWSTIRLEDKGGVLICPPDLVINCDVDYHNFDATGGFPRSYSACSELPNQLDTIEVIEDTEPKKKKATEGFVPGYIGVEVPEFNPACGFGAIRREFGNLCTQWIVVEDPYQLRFDASTLNFPDDVIIDCMDADTGVPEWQEAGCNLIGYTLESDTFSFATGACLKVRNVWNVINWCLYYPSDPDQNNVVDEMDADGDMIPNLIDTDDDNDGIPDDTFFNNDNGTPSDPTDDFLDYEPDLFDPVIEDSGAVEGLYQMEQIIKLLDEEPPEIDCIEEICFAVGNDECFGGKYALTAISKDRGECPSPIMAWTVHIDLYDDWNFDYEYSSFLPKLVDGEPNPFYLKQTANQSQIVVPLPEGIPASKQVHRADWILFDGCGNKDEHTTYFTIEDKTAPTPYCLDISTATMVNGEVELWASDFNRGSFDNCSNDLVYTFTDVPPPPRCDDEYDNVTDGEWYDGSYWFYDSELIEDDPTDNDCDIDGYGEYSNAGYNRISNVFENYRSPIHKWVPANNTSGAIFTTENVNINGFLDLPVYVWDECGNNDYCMVRLRVINGTNGTGMITGRIATEDGQLIPEAQAQLMSDTPNYPKFEMSDDTGVYAFENTVMEEDYELSVVKDGDDLNGISTRDLLAIQRHILAISTLDSPYKMIAADVNNDKSVNGRDLVELRKLILGIYTEFPQNTSWKMVDASQDLRLSNPWIYNEVRTIGNMSVDMMEEDFIGVKIGDVDNSVEVNFAGTIETRSQPLQLEYADRMVSEGQEFEVRFSTDQDLLGLQMTLDHSNLKLIEVSGLNINEDSYFDHDGQLALSFGSMNTVQGDILKLTFVAKEYGLLSGFLNVNSTIVKAEAYLGSEMKTVGIVLEGTGDESFHLYQNSPNPFNGNTRISYSLPADMDVQFSFYDLTGRRIYEIRRSGEKGLNVLELTSDKLAEGLIYYRLETNGFTATKQMTVIE